MSGTAMNDSIQLEHFFGNVIARCERLARNLARVVVFFSVANHNPCPKMVGNVANAGLFTYETKSFFWLICIVSSILLCAR